MRRRQKATPSTVRAATDVGARDLASLRPDDWEVRIARHQFPLGVVAGSLALVLRTGTRLQRVADVLTMHGKWCRLDVTAASYYSVRLWLLRLGLYQLSRPKVQADDWMWIMDHTMQLGERKCLIVVGLRQSAWNAQDRVLGHQDVELIDLVPVTESNGKVVYRKCTTVTLVCDNLNTHTMGAFYEAFPPARARALVCRLDFCHTPKHGSWLNIAENELSSLTRQCVSGRRFGDLTTLRSEIGAWSTDVNTTQRGVDWQMRITHARYKLKSLYPKNRL